MRDEIIRTPLRPTGKPLLQVLASVPVACFCGAFATDVAYAATADMIWADFSAWLLAAAILFSGLAALVGLVGLILHRGASRTRPVWPVALGAVVVLTLGLFDNLVHSRDAWTSVVPMGLTLSAVTAVLVLLTAWLAFRSEATAPVLVRKTGVYQ